MIWTDFHGLPLYGFALYLGFLATLAASAASNRALASAASMIAEIALTRLFSVVLPYYFVYVPVVFGNSVFKSIIWCDDK